MTASRKNVGLILVLLMSVGYSVTPPVLLCLTPDLPHYAIYDESSQNLHRP